MTRTCSKCGVEKSIEDFYKHPNYKDGRKKQCKRCELDALAERRKDPEVRERINANARRRRAVDEGRFERNRRHDLWRTYRLTPEGYDELLASQGGGCAICHAVEPGGNGRFHVDHDHRCCDGKKSCGECIRGLLCSRCNVGIGMLGDSVDHLFAAAAYIIERAKAPAFLQALGSTV